MSVCDGLADHPMTECVLDVVLEADWKRGWECTPSQYSAH